MPKDESKKNTPPKKPEPWYLGWGLAKFAAEALKKRQKEMKEKMEQAQK